MPLTPEQLDEIVRELVTKPGHEKVRTLVHDLLVHGLGASSSDVTYEVQMTEVRGRADALLGRTVVEFKSDLQAEMKDAEKGLTKYLTHRENDTGEHYVGIATDGAQFQPFELVRGTLVAHTCFNASKDNPQSLLEWLGRAVMLAPELAPDPEIVQRELGKTSLAFEVANSALADIWADVKDQPDVVLRRDLWSKLLQIVYGSNVEEEILFFQHTYLTIVAKTMAVRVLDIAIPDADDLLSGKDFADADIHGAVESDFFDWLLESPKGAAVVNRIANQVARFRLRNVEHDVLKGLYESLIDPEQRRELGEYYTPDWLASRMVNRVIDDPLNQRVLDPACGSGTFPFHAARRLLETADGNGMSNAKALRLCTEKVLGIDIHPVAVIIARVTYLLALGEDRLTAKDRPPVSIPIYLGESMQWSTQTMFAEKEVRIEVPGSSTPLEFPWVVSKDPGLFDEVLSAMLRLIEDQRTESDFKAWLKAKVIGEGRDRSILAKTYSELKVLNEDERNHIWGYVARNLSRPIWLSGEDQRSDILIGNPPWLSYNKMSLDMQKRFKAECEKRNLWAGGKVATNQDLSGYFFARCVELYLKSGGWIAFVMPYAAIGRKQFEGFRTGQFISAFVCFREVWAFTEKVKPLFPVPASVFIAEQSDPCLLPPRINTCVGVLPKRDASADEADTALMCADVDWAVGVSEAASNYSPRFRQGATVVPQLLWLVVRSTLGKLGGNPKLPIVESYRSSLQKAPWKHLPSLKGKLEAEFLRQLYMGSSLAPYRTLGSMEALIPLNEKTGVLMDSTAAQKAGLLEISSRLAEAEALWNEHGKGRMTLLERLDYQKELTAQLPIPKLRVIYAASGSQPAAAILQDESAFVEHKLYWAPVQTISEGQYLEAILNSETARSRVEHLQSRGQFGARDFDKLMLDHLPIPEFDVTNSLHAELATQAKLAENIAEEVALPSSVGFQQARKLIREALEAEGVAKDIDVLVHDLLS